VFFNIGVIGFVATQLIYGRIGNTALVQQLQQGCAIGSADEFAFVVQQFKGIPFLWIVIELLGGLKSSIDKQPASARGLINGASYLLILSWAFYPVVFVLPMLGVEGSTAATYVQVGYSIADIVAKAVFGVLIFAIAVKKSEAEAHA
jgi:hypothetical protein